LNWRFEGDLIAITVVIALLVDIHRNRSAQETFKDVLFKKIVIVCVAAIASGMLTTTCILSQNAIPPWTIRLFKAVYGILVPFSIFLWFYFTLANVLENEKLQNKIAFWVSVPLIFYGFFAIYDIFSGYFTQGKFGFSAMVAISLCYSMATFVVVLPRRSHLAFNKWRALIFYPFVFLVSIVYLWITKSHALVNIALCIVVLTTYLVIQNQRNSLDSLTGLQNRIAFINQLDRILPHAKGVVLIADIDNFKYFNQKFGQANGDRLLKSIAIFFQGITSDRNAFRYGGDQFALLLKDATEEKAATLLQLIEQRFLRTWAVGKTDANALVRLGLVSFPEHAQNSGELVNAIDLTLSEARNLQTKATIHYRMGLMEKHQHRQEIEHALARTLAHGKIILHYQPIFEISTGKIYSAEALVRLDDEQLGFLLPSEFIGIAEETGMIIELTQLIVKNVCDLWNRLQNCQFDLRRIAINLSAVHFIQPFMEQTLLKIIKSNGVDPWRFRFELTETMLVQSFERVKDVMKNLSNEGVTFSMDDYGKGYSSVEYLINLPFDTIKLDRSIIANCSTHYDLLESIIIMLHRLDRKIIAEGVETSEQLEVVTRAGTDRAQGFYLAKPMPEEEFIAFIKQKAIE
jgi:diguanylate cyclase